MRFHYIITVHLPLNNNMFFSSQVAGLLYRANVCKVHSILRIPAFVSLLIDKTLGPLVTSAAPKDEVPPYGATLELQRQQHIEQLEQQLAWAQLQPRPPGGVSVHFDSILNIDTI